MMKHANDEQADIIGSVEYTVHSAFPAPQTEARRLIDLPCKGRRAQKIESRQKPQIIGISSSLPMFARAIVNDGFEIAICLPT